MRRSIILIIAAAGTLTAGCESGETSDFLNMTDSVCTEFGTFIRDGRPADQRSDVISSMGEVIVNADQGVQDGFEALTNTVNGSASAQQLADDVFAQSCLDAGFGE